VVLRHYMHAGRQIRGTMTAGKARGFSLIEVMIAMAVLSVGLLGGMVVIAMATANDGRSKLHTTAMTLAQSTMETILSVPPGAAGLGTQRTIPDCTGGPAFTVETGPAGATLPVGSPLITSGAFAGSVDFSQARVPNYSMLYVMCSVGSNVAYDIRWTIEQGPTPSTRWVTVSAKPVASGAAQFTLPFTLRQLKGGF
jgi:prepilin-type N-terminal cleavage/methylation domain-containing protein